MAYHYLAVHQSHWKDKKNKIVPNQTILWTNLDAEQNVSMNS